MDRPLHCPDTRRGAASQGNSEDGDMTISQQQIQRKLNATRQILRCIFVAVLLLLILTPPAHAYVGPGSGFAVLSSFLTLFLASMQAVFAFLTWPIRQFFRFLRRRRAYRRAKTKRVVILGFDGMDPELTERFIKEGKLPNLARLRESGTFRTLATT